MTTSHPWCAIQFPIRLATKGKILNELFADKSFTAGKHSSLLDKTHVIGKHSVLLSLLAETAGAALREQRSEAPHMLQKRQPPPLLTFLDSGRTSG